MLEAVADQLLLRHLRVKQRHLVLAVQAQYRIAFPNELNINDRGEGCADMIRAHQLAVEGREESQNGAFLANMVPFALAETNL